MIKTKKTIANNCVVKQEEKGSKFIGYSFSVFSQEQVQNFLQEVKNLHPKATHICYAYSLEGVQKAEDDGEPSGTAGMPILTVLEKQALQFVLLVVVRYFGGTKLGAGGLLRAYSSVASKTLAKSKKQSFGLFKRYYLVAEYDVFHKQIAKMQNKFFTLCNVQFLEQVTCEINILQEQEQSVLNKLKPMAYKLEYITQNYQKI